MQIVEQTSTVLKLQAMESPPGFVGFLFGIPLFLAGLAILTSGKLAELKCNRVEPTQVACELISSSLLGKHITPIPTGQLQGAEVEVSKDSEGVTTEQFVLLTKNGKIPATEVYSSGAEVKINAFVSNPQQMSLNIQQDDRRFAHLCGSIVILVDSSFIFYSLVSKRLTSYTFDKGSHRMYVKRQNVFTSEVREQMLDEIKGVEVVIETTVITDNTDEPTSYYRTSLVLRSGEQIPLQLDGSEAEKQKIAQSINQFLGVTS